MVSHLVEKKFTTFSSSTPPSRLADCEQERPPTQPLFFSELTHPHPRQHRPGSVLLLTIDMGIKCYFDLICFYISKDVC